MNLAKRVTMQLILATLAATAIYAAAEISREREYLIDNSSELHEILMENAYPVVTNSFWEFNKNSMQSVLNSLFTHGSVTQALVLNARGEFFAGIVREKVATSEKNLKITEPKPLTTIPSLASIVPEAQPGVPLHPFHSSFHGVSSQPKLISHMKYRKIASIWHTDTQSNSKHFLGYFVVDYSQEHIATAIAETQKRVILWSVVLVTGIVALITYFLRSSVIQPIQNLAAAAQKVASGSFSEVTPPSHADEIGTLTNSFNHMVRAVRKSLDNLNSLEVEQQKIARILNFTDLAIQISTSLEHVLGMNTNPCLFVRRDLLEDSAPYQFTKICTHSPSCPANTCASEQTQKRARLNIIDASADSILGYIDYDDKVNISQNPQLDSMVRSLLVAITTAIENIRFIKEQRKSERMQGELDTAKLVQRTLIPPSGTTQLEHYVVVSHSQPATECGGDWWNYYKLDNGNLLVFLGDVTGHGTASALITAVAKGYCDSLHWQNPKSPAQILEELNQVVARTSNNLERAMSMFCAIIDTRNNKITFANAGHPHPLVVHTQNEARAPYSNLLATGPLLGWYATQSEESTQSNTYHNSEAPFLKGDILFAFTDGLIENKNSQGETLQEAGLRKTIKEKWGSNANELCSHVAKASKPYCSKQQCADDVTFIAIQRS